MADTITPEKRSEIMGRVRGKNTGPEVAVRKMLHRMGYRFRLHVKTLPGTPDIVLPRHHKAVLVHGCFWHGHKGCPRAKLPTTRTDFWAEKILKNKHRDAGVVAQLSRMGYSILIVWTCELRRPDALSKRLEEFMRGNDGAQIEERESGRPAP
jgi:DNA mismatch endonuclease (patch repair protein)